MLLVAVLTLDTFVYCFATIFTGTTADTEDAYLSVPQLATKYGYPIEEHRVLTPDGYVLTIHRIPHGKNAHRTSRKVVLLQHGMFASSAFWILTGPGHCLGYLLADQGYDVWLGNQRGNSYSKQNIYLSRDDKRFWTFSWHEIGSIDLTTMIDYVLGQTRQKNLFHIGHSQGTTSFYVMATTRPEYNAKIKAHISLSPVVYMKHIGSPPLQFLARFFKTLKFVGNLFGFHRFMDRNPYILTPWLEKLCGPISELKHVCANTFYLINGFSPNINTTVLPIAAGHIPDGTSTMQLMHYSQGITEGSFRQYNFGLMNLWKYKSFTPPIYDLSKVTAPVYLFYAKTDWLSDAVDVYRLCRELGSSCKAMILVANGTFAHMDYGLGTGAPELVYENVISLMNTIYSIKFL